MNFGSSFRHLVERAQPLRGGDIVAVHEGDAAVLHDIAGEQHAVRLDHHHDVAGGMRRPRIEQRQPPVAERDRHALAEGDIRRHHAGIGVDPREQRAAPLLEALVRLLVGGLFIVLVFAGALLRDDEGVAVIPERLQAVDVVGMIMAQHHVADFLVGDFADFLQQRPAEARRAQRIEHHDAVGRHDKSGVGGIAFILLAGNAGIARRVPDRLARHLIDLQRDGQRRIRRNGLRAGRKGRAAGEQRGDENSLHLMVPQ